MFSNKIHEDAEKALKKGNTKEALKLYTKALEKSPNDINILSDRGVAYLHLNDKDKCFKDLNLAIDLQPEYGFRYACRAYAKRHFNDLNGAVEDYEMAVKLDPNDAVALNNLGLLLEEKGYKEEAERKFKQADELSKIEDHLIDTIEGIESSQSKKEESINEKKEEPTEKSKKKKAVQEFKKVFTSVEQFNEFMQFIKDGFKLKK